MSGFGRAWVSYGEDALVEQPAIRLLEGLGWERRDCFGEFGEPGGSLLGRGTDHEVVLVKYLRFALRRLNPGLSGEALELAVAEIARDRSAMSAERANQDVYGLLRDGVRVTVQRPDGSSDVERVRVIDWREPKNNDYLLASQFWVHGEIYRRRCDLVGFVNGIPLVLVELKATHKKLENAHKDNLRDYREAIPELFWFNAFVVLSNGSETRAGSTFAPWEHFAEWKRINSEGEQGVVSLETVIRGTCDPPRLLDVVENFVVFEEARGGLIKILAKNHQYLGVNRAIEAVGSLGENRGRLGVFWHTQGSGKSVSMAFLSQKILRTIPGNWTFVVVTDRRELDDQIYKSFAAWGAVTEVQAQAEGSADLRRLLREDHRYVFTLIQKFRTEPGEAHPVLSERDDVIVIADEAHRTQYDSFALNMRTALPNAAFLGFTGTPLIVGEERTKEVFGDYVSTYDFRQSREDGATVPLYYENRIPELELTNEDLNDELYAVVEEAVLDEAQEAKLQQELARQYHLITREDRLDTVAKDIVEHFMGRGYPGKAMVICIDKATAVRMHDKVTAHWKNRLAGLRERLPEASPGEKAALEADIGLMEETDMAVVVSQSQNEVSEMAEQGPGHHAASQADAGRGPRHQVQGSGRPVQDRLRLRDVDDRLRRPELLDDLPRQADAQPHADADDRQSQPRHPGQARRADRRLRRHPPRPRESTRDLRARQRRQSRSRSRAKTNSSHYSKPRSPTHSASCASTRSGPTRSSRRKGSTGSR